MTGPLRQTHVCIVHILYCPPGADSGGSLLTGPHSWLHNPAVRPRVHHQIPAAMQEAGLSQGRFQN